MKKLNSNLDLTENDLKPFFEPITKNADRIMNYFLAGYFLASLFFSMQYNTYTIGISVSLLCTAAYYLSKKLLPNSNFYQYVLSTILAVYMALFIYQMHGMFEMHFFAFVGSCILIIYQNWKLQIPLALYVVAHHSVFAYLQNAGNEIYFTQLTYMSLETLLIHAVLAAIIFAICGLWAYTNKENTIKDAVKSLELKNMQKVLEESTSEELEKLALVASKTNNGVIIIDNEGKIEWVNDAYTTISGYSSEESIGKQPGSLLHGELTQESVVLEMQEKFKSKEPFVVEIINYHKNGSPYWVSTNMTPVLNENNEVTKFIAIETDITARKNLEEKFISTHVLQKAVLDVTSYGIISTNKEGIITSYNKGAEKMLGYTADEVVNKTTPAMFHVMSEVKERTDELNKELGLNISPGMDTFTTKIKNGIEGATEWTFVRKDGTKLAASLTLSLLKKENEITGFVGIWEDITGRKLNEEKLRITQEEENDRNWVNEGLTKLSNILKIDTDNTKKLCSGFLNLIIECTNSLQGAVYLTKQNNKVKALELAAGFAIGKDLILSPEIQMGEGLAGQAALDKTKIILTNPPDNYLKITSVLGETKPGNIVVYPFLHEDKVMGVIELASLKEFNARTIEFIEKALSMIALALDVIERKINTENLLKESQILNQQLQAQEEELRVSNEELTEKSQLLQSSEEELRVQQEELMQTNIQLEEKADLLEKKNTDVKNKNEELQRVQEEIRLKAEQLEQTSKYKSEFLANMSHELRTPLNSILVLSNLLAENKTENLTEKQIEFSKVIQKSGSDLLNLIDDILDLSKIESGKMELLNEEIKIKEFAHDFESLFTELAKSKGIEFKVNVDKNLGNKFISDKMKVEQIIKNLLSNAFKFTAKQGTVTLNIFAADKTSDFKKDTLLSSKSVIGFSVKDSGIGIPEDKQKIIFEAFKQADGSTNRKYGGTGLGLSISRELANLLGGEIRLSSVNGEGSTFSIYLPATVEVYTLTEPIANELKIKLNVSEIKNKEIVEKAPEKKSVLIIEDDLIYSEMLTKYAIDRGFSITVARDGNKGFESIRKMKPDAVILDLNLPGMSGWEILKRIKEDKEVNNIPVHIVSASDQKSLGLELGAVDFIQKPFKEDELSKLFESILKLSNFEKILVIEDNKNQFEAINALFGHENIICESALTSKEALEKLKENTYQLIILDLSLPDIDGTELLILIREDEKYTNVPIIIYTGKSLSRDEESALKKYSNTIIIKTQNSYSKLLDEVHLFLNKVDGENGAKLPDFKSKKSNGVITNGHSKEYSNEILKNRKVLIVDDDMRNIFTLSNLLENYEMNLVIANDGRESLEKLSENPDTEIVLMDIMMPGMDGYEAIAEMRKNKNNNSLPIIALTARAMKGDKEKCISAGASDHIVKPIDINKLLSILKIWLAK